MKYIIIVILAILCTIGTTTIVLFLTGDLKKCKFCTTKGVILTNTPTNSIIVGSNLYVYRVNNDSIFVQKTN